MFLWTASDQYFLSSSCRYYHGGGVKFSNKTFFCRFYCKSCIDRYRQLAGINLPIPGNAEPPYASNFDGAMMACLYCNLFMHIDDAFYLSICLCTFIYLSVCMCIFLYLSICLCIFIYLSVCLFMFICLCIFIYLYVCLFMFICLCIFIYLYVCLSIFLYPSVCTKHLLQNKFLKRIYPGPTRLLS